MNVYLVWLTSYAPVWTARIRHEVQEVCPTCEGEPYDFESNTVCPTCQGACVFAKSHTVTIFSPNREELLNVLEGYLRGDDSRLTQLSVTYVPQP